MPYVHHGDTDLLHQESESPSKQQENYTDPY
jgi:hypothetical protein